MDRCGLSFRVCILIYTTILGSSGSLYRSYTGGHLKWPILIVRQCKTRPKIVFNGSYLRIHIRYCCLHSGCAGWQLWWTKILCTDKVCSEGWLPPVWRDTIPEDQELAVAWSQSRSVGYWFYTLCNFYSVFQFLAMFPPMVTIAKHRVWC